MADVVYDYGAHFRRYAEAYERSLGDHVDVEGIRAFFAADFLASTVNGAVSAGKNDDSFGTALEQAYAFYKAIGTRGMRVDRVEAAPLYDGHDRVQVFYVAEYARKDGSAMTIAFDVLYLLRRQNGEARIFAFISGDEMALYRSIGLVDADGKPA